MAFTTASILMTLLWQMFPGAVGFRRFDLWVWFVCCGVVLLSASRFSIRHPVPLPEAWLLASLLVAEVFSRYLCPTAAVASADEFLWCFDSGFGYPQPSLGRLLIRVPSLFWLCRIVYAALPVLFVSVYVGLPGWVRARYLAAITCTGCVILPLYGLCPAAGPVYLFRDNYPYPDHLPVPLLHPHARFLPPGLLLNAAPSGHMAWALLLFWFSFRYCRRWTAAVFAVIVLLTILATLGLGEHYVIDLILSVPYAAAIWALSRKQWKRAAAFLALVAAWLVPLRFGWALELPRPAVWVLCTLTVCSPVFWPDRRSTAAAPGGSLLESGSRPVLTCAHPADR